MIPVESELQAEKQIHRRRGRGRAQPMPLPPRLVDAVWDLGGWIDCRRTSRGSSNLSYFLDTDKGRFVLRLSNDRKTGVGMAQEVALLDHLAARGLPVPRVVATRSGEGWSVIEGGFCMVTVRLPGEHGDPRHAGHARESGRVLARFHAEGRNLPPAARPLFASDLPNLAVTGPVLGEAAELAASVLAPADQLRLRAAVEDLSESWARASVGMEGSEPWPTVVTHGSLGSTAVLFHEGCLSALLDVERAADEARSLDLAYTIRGFTRDRDSGALDWGRMTAVMDGYREVDPVPEIGSMPLALQVQRLLKIRRKSANFLRQAGAAATVTKDGDKFLEMLEDEASRIAWLEQHQARVGEALRAGR